MGVGKIQMQNPDIFLFRSAIGFSEIIFLDISLPIILKKDFTGLWTIYFGPHKRC